MADFLYVSGITMEFGGLTAVDDVSFHVDKGEIVSLIGPNGAGKTTVFNMLTGVYSITAGEMSFQGERLNERTPQDIVKLGISRTFQNLRLFPNMRVIENVMLGMHIHTKYSFFEGLLRLPSFRREEDEKAVRALEILDSIGMAWAADDYAGSLPYGDQRKVEIARAMATDAKLLLLDEPAAGMNPAESRDLLTFIRHLKDIGYTVLLIEHDMNVVMNISDRIYVLDHGRRIAEGLPDEIAANQDVIDAYLGGERKSHA
ncbi:MAG: ABC transporter ATP-binding protein [Clostridiales bacterium]|nr:ABC transporter ATP-binding protein [Clostridiales bacterium]